MLTVTDAISHHQWRIYHWVTWAMLPSLNCQKISHMAKNATLQQLSQLKIKIVATRCQILRLKCAKVDFGWGPPQTPGPPWGSPDGGVYSASQTPSWV